MSFFQDRRVLVTGGTGFIGYHLVRRLLADGARITVLVRRAGSLGRLEANRADLQVIEQDLRDSSLCGLDLEPPDYIFHLAAAGVERPLDDWPGAIEANITGTANLLHWCCDSKMSDLRAFVYTGTPFEYGDGEGLRREDSELQPPNFYAASKAAGWLFCQAFASLHHLPIVGVRPFLTYGPHQGTRRLIPDVIIAALQERDISLTGGQQRRDFIYIDDVVDGLLCAAQTVDARGHMFNLGSGHDVTLQDVVQRILALTDSRARPLFGAIPYRKGELWDLRADTQKTQQALNWSAKTSLDDGLQKTIAWYRDNLSNLDLN